MTVSIPDYVQAEGFVAVYWLPAGSNLAALTVTEYGAGVDLTPFFPTVWEGFGGDQARGEQTRMSMRETFEILGKIKRSIADMTYTHMPQSALTVAANKAKSMLAEGSSGIVACRAGILAPTAIAATQRYQAIRATVGMGRDNTTGTDEFAPLTRTSALSAVGSLVDGVVAAG